MIRSNLSVANLKISCIAVAFFVLVSAVPAYAQSPAPEATEITATVQRFRGALAQGDPKVAMEMLAPDAVILESGAMQTREEYAREHLPGDIAFAKRRARV